MGSQLRDDDASHRCVPIKPWRQFEPEFCAIRRWCRENNQSFNSLINMLAVPLAYALANTIQTDEKTGKKFIRFDFGRIDFLPSNQEMMKLAWEQQQFSMVRHRNQNLIGF